MEKRELSSTVDGNANRYGHYGEQYKESLKKQEIKPTVEFPWWLQMVKNLPAMRETWV